MVGFFKVGASLFQIISALGIPLTALIARVVIKRRQSVLQWIGITVIVVGFFSNTIFPYIVAHQAAASNLSTEETLAKQDVSLGILMTVSGFVLASGLGVGIEKLIHEPNSPTPSKICSYLGIYSTMLCCAVQLLFIVPFRYHGIYTVFSDALGISGIDASKEAWIYLFKFFGGFVLMTLVHAYQNYSNYILIEAWGVIPMGILSASRSVVIMLISSVLYCKSDSNQCFTPDKLTSAVIVTCGVLFYNFASFKKASIKS
ncbi:hypothetical protein DSO57_1001072 [Entomophthora muscae]|uniref:Uncharacterized protein n=1 Tax=Entomophthora muscae TaxID=34485 RepID=A0ACC2RP16_9FUNG|nr:hypothetical protein DSO57_1001072 [Entomophthora muscae]